MDAGGLGDGGGDAQDGFAGAFAVAYVGGVEGAQDGPPVAGGFVEDVVGGEGVADDVGGGLPDPGVGWCCFRGWWAGLWWCGVCCVTWGEVDEQEGQEQVGNDRGHAGSP